MEEKVANEKGPVLRPVVSQTAKLKGDIWEKEWEEGLAVVDFLGEAVEGRLTSDREKRGRRSSTQGSDTSRRATFPKWKGPPPELRPQLMAPTTIPLTHYPFN